MFCHAKSSERKRGWLPWGQAPLPLAFQCTCYNVWTEVSFPPRPPAKYGFAFLKNYQKQSRRLQPGRGRGCLILSLTAMLLFKITGPPAQMCWNSVVGGEWGKSGKIIEGRKKIQSLFLPSLTLRLHLHHKFSPAWNWKKFKKLTLTSCAESWEL